MAEGNGLERNWEDHKRIERNLARLHRDVKIQTENLNKLLGALRHLIDRIPPENLKPKGE